MHDLISVFAQMEKTWEQRLEKVRREKCRETAETACQAAEPEASGGTVTVEELDIRLRAQKQQLLLEADKVKHKAVEEARKQTQRQLHKKNLEDMAKQVRDFLQCILLLCSRLGLLAAGEQMCLHFRLKAQ